MEAVTSPASAWRKRLRVASDDEAENRPPAPSCWEGDGAVGCLAPASPAPQPECGSPTSSLRASPPPLQVTATATAASGAAEARPSAPLVLSPSAQLDVLSQISEMAERSALMTGQKLLDRQSNPSRRHAWDLEATAVAEEDSSDSRYKTAKKRKKSAADVMAAAAAENRTARARATRRAAPSSSWRTEAITRDMLDWETCSDDSFMGELANDDDGSEDDALWTFGDISDSDFE